MGVRLRTRRPLSADERARLAALVRECGPRLLAYVRHFSGKRTDAEEIVAETFCRAAGNMDALGRCERQELYLLTVARNLCRDHFRRARPATSPAPRLEQAGADPEPYQSASGQEQRQVLRAAVAALPEPQREVVTLRLSTNLKFEEIAELLQVPLGTVLSRMHAAVRRLREDLGCAHER